MNGFSLTQFAPSEQHLASTSVRLWRLCVKDPFRR
jgi:hypothetical protein